MILKRKKELRQMLAILMFVNVLASCATLRNNSASADLTILILDENDKALTDYEIFLQPEKSVKEKDRSSAFTNKSGFGLFYQLPLGQYIITGKKEGYTAIEEGPLLYKEETDLFCYRVYSASFILLQAEELYKKEQYQKALDLLQRLYPGSNAGLQKTLLFYKAYAYAKLKQKEKAESQVREIAELKDSAFDASKYCQAIESLLVAMD